MVRSDTAAVTGEHGDEEQLVVPLDGELEVA